MQMHKAFVHRQNETSVVFTAFFPIWRIPQTLPPEVFHKLQTIPLSLQPSATCELTGDFFIMGDLARSLHVLKQ
jgi:hypothetical protein